MRVRKNSGREYTRDKFEERLLRLLYREKPFETRNPRRLCARALERLTRSRGTDQERSESHDPRYSAR